MHDKVVYLGTRLRYPITITKLLKKPGDTIKKQENIVEYKFSWKREVNQDEWIDQTTYTEFDSPAEGILREWRIEEGMVINADTACMTVEEACGHEVQIQGLCSLCGADMTEYNWAMEGREADRAMINMTHDQTGLMVSQSVAMKAEHDAQKRLLRQRKLSLVVDLDQTIIHACIDPTVGEWQSDPQNPNHGAVKDVRSFQLSDDGPRGLASGCTYYVKMRPGLEEFLEEISNMYELHVYTMGTRAYAQNIAKIVDPEGKLFGNRVISRDENGSITAKHLHRLFPVSTNMVVIIDDRSDVWPMNRPNLIKVVPYDFFKGIGDINSSFLPKRTDIIPAAQPNGTNSAASNTSLPDRTNTGDANKRSPLDELARMSGADDEENLKSQAEEQEKTLTKQLNERPLQHLQEKLDKEDEEAPHNSNNNELPSGGHHRQNLLNDDDEELIALQDHLTDLHRAFYETYDKRREDRKEAEGTHRPGHSKPRRKSVDDGVDLSMVPDVGDVLDNLKNNVLEGLVIVLSGLVPLGVKVAESEIGMQAQSHGAQVLDNISKRVTHLVVESSRPRTKKVQQAAKIPSIHIVNQNWLTDCLSQWRRLDESPYFINIAAADRLPSGELTEASEAEDDDGREMKDTDWQDVDQELAEFLGSDDSSDTDTEGEGEGYDVTNDSDQDDEDSDGTTESGSQPQAVQGTKRKAEDVDQDDDDLDSNIPESALAKKQRLARNRGASSLRSVRAPNDEGNADDDGDGGGLPTPGPTTGDEEMTESQRKEKEAAEQEMADLEKDLIAEMETMD
jgi:RNA polymerase II subunit A C-terminal domain phosphatase